MPVDVYLEDTLEDYMPFFGMHNQDVDIRAVQRGISRSKKGKKANKNKVSPEMQDALRRIYIRYLVSFAAQNEDSVCNNALFRVAACNL
jgi:hypothetical protein